MRISSQASRQPAGGRPEPNGQDIHRLLPQSVVVPVRDTQPVQDLRVSQLIRGDIGLEDDVIHQLPVPRLVAQHRQGLVDPVQQQPGLLDAQQLMLQFGVVHGQLGIHRAQQRVKVLQRPVQFLRHPLREALQRPDDVPVVLQHTLGVVVHVPAQLPLRLPDPLTGDLRVLHDAPALQQGDKLLRLGRQALMRVTTGGCLQMFHTRFLLGCPGPPSGVGPRQNQLRARLCTYPASPLHNSCNSDTEKDTRV